MTRREKNTIQMVEEILKELAQRGELTPSRVLHDAESPNSPLHGYFEWDDTEAAKQHRLHQARVLIRSVKVDVIVEERPVSVSYFVRDPEKPLEEQGYIGIDHLRIDPIQAREYLTREVQTIEDRLSRMVAYAKVLEVQEQLSTTREQVATLSNVLHAIH